MVDTKATEQLLDKLLQVHSSLNHNQIISKTSHQTYLGLNEGFELPEENCPFEILGTPSLSSEHAWNSLVVQWKQFLHQQVLAMTWQQETVHEHTAILHSNNGFSHLSTLCRVKGRFHLYRYRIGYGKNRESGNTSAWFHVHGRDTAMDPDACFLTGPRSDLCCTIWVNRWACPRF